MTNDPRTPEAQRSREARPAEDPRRNPGSGDPRERTHDRRETAADGSRETARKRPPDRAEHSAHRNGSRIEPAERVQHSPGEVHSDAIVDFWPDRAADGLRERWRELQLLFVDDPKAAVAGADAVLGETIEVLNGSLQAARSDLSEWRNRRVVDTEGLRVAVQRYRNVLDRVLAL
ncbi:MAG TPA: hypothetical protein VFY84_06785 [Jiangellales bacterium]|nr:hypothetical protein [Jiangellales bacterium]